MFEFNSFSRKTIIHIAGELSTEAPGDVEYLSCPQLESVTLNYAQNFSDKWNSFLNNHQHLKILNINYCPFDQLVALTANLTHLEEIKIHLNDEFESIQEIRNFLQSHQTLKKAHFSTAKSVDGSEIQILCDSIENEWNFEEFTKYDDCYIEYNLVLTKKNAALLQ